MANGRPRASTAPDPAGPEPGAWSARLLRALQSYDEPLLRDVAARLIKPRSQWPADELIRRMAETAGNAPVVDRRLSELPSAGRHLLALIGISRQPRWHVGNLVELVTALGHPDGLSAVTALLETGLLHPDGGEPREAAPAAKVKSFEAWLGLTDPSRLVVFAHPDVTRRALREDLGLPDLSALEGGPAAPPFGTTPREADGLEWPLRLAVLRQQAAQSPFRLTQNGDLFKRDLDRLGQDPLLSAQPVDSPVETPDVGMLTLALGLGDGLVRERDGEVVAGQPPAAWQQGLPATLASLWATLPTFRRWNSGTGGRPREGAGNPYPSAYLLALLLLARVTDSRWCPAAAVAEWVRSRHPFWAATPTDGTPATTPARPTNGEPDGVVTFLLTLAYQLRLVQAAKGTEGDWLVRLSPLGRWVLGQGDEPKFPAFPKTLLVQPNLEILLYRQGATPELLSRVGLFAAWKGLGAACSLQLQPETVYAALEAGETFESILKALEQHGMKATPPAVVDSLRTWAQKRERITVYASGTVLEFVDAADLEDALARGVPAVRVADRLAVIAREADIDYRHFRLTANRDYTLPPEPCVQPDPDGVTLRVDLNRSDLMVESEVRRFAEEFPDLGGAGARVFRLTPTSAAAALAAGLTPDNVAGWFLTRTGGELPPAARLLLTAGKLPPPSVRQAVVVRVAAPETADGLYQWPDTRPLLGERLGPCAFTVPAAKLSLLRERLRPLGIQLPAPAGDEPADEEPAEPD